MTPDAIALFSQFGFPGVLIGYLIYRDGQQAKEKAELQKLQSEETKLKSEADKALATSLAALTVMIQNLAERLK